MTETAWLLASTGSVNKTLVFVTRPICSKNALSVRSRMVGLQTPLTAITANTHGSGAAGEHALNDQLGPFGDSMTTIDEKAVPAVINLKEKLCGSGNIHARNYSGRRLLRTAIYLQCLSSAAGGYCSVRYC